MVYYVTFLLINCNKYVPFVLQLEFLHPGRSVICGSAVSIIVLPWNHLERNMIITISGHAIRTKIAWNGDFSDDFYSDSCIICYSGRYYHISPFKARFLKAQVCAEIKGTALDEEGLRKHAEEMARNHPPGKYSRSLSWLIRRLNDNYSLIYGIYRDLSRDVKVAAHTALG